MSPAKLYVKPLGPLARSADAVAFPLMRISMVLNGTPDESPMLTHRWNNHHLKESDIIHLNHRLMVEGSGDNNARMLNGLQRHLPGKGWQKYIVVIPTRLEHKWHIGWRWSGGGGVSRIPLFGSVRVLRGPGLVQFFAIDSETFEQIGLRRIGEGRLGNGSGYRSRPIL